MTRIAHRIAIALAAFAATALAGMYLLGIVALVAPAASANPAPAERYTPALLTVDAENAPADLVDSLLERGYIGDPNDHAERLYVAVGTVVDVPGGLYLATVDGWMGCEDGRTFDGECYATGPMVPVDVSAPVVDACYANPIATPADDPALHAVCTAEAAAPADQAQAVALIAERVASGQPIEEDLTWSGAPSVVFEQNDSILAAAGK